jgi:predicted nuclease with TOPRIM domain
MFGALKIYGLIIVFGVLAGGAYAAKSYYESTQATIAQLRENNAKLEVANETNQNTIKRMEQDTVLLQESIASLNTDLQAAEAYKDELIQKLQKHDLSMLSLRKPGLIESRINNGTKGVFDALEALSNPTAPSPSN